MSNSFSVMLLLAAKFIKVKLAHFSSGWISGFQYVFLEDCYPSPWV